MSRRPRTATFAAALALLGTLLVAPPPGPLAAAPPAAAGGRVFEPVTAAHPPAPESFRTGVSAADPCATPAPAPAALCMTPFPDDFYTVPDRATVTGRRVAIPSGAFPAATGQAPFDPTPFDTGDGFSPGSTLLVHVPGVDLAKSGVATISDMGASLRPSSPVVLLDTDTGQRWPTWAELDVRDHDPQTQLLLIHPTQALTEGDHFVVALRDLRSSTGALIPATASLSSALTAGSHATAEARHARTDLDALRHAGLSTAELFDVWDFTVASRQSLTAPELAMRDQAFAILGSKVPAYSVTRVVDDPPNNPSLQREVTGTFEVPNFLNQPGGPDSAVLHLGAGGLPTPLPGNSYTATFDCEIPRAASAAHPARVGVYGHGLFGSSAEVYASAVPQFSNAYDYVFCGTDWVGLASGDLPLAATVVTDLSQFPRLVAHLMQSLVDAQYLGRLLDDPKGFAASAAFAAATETPGGSLIDPRSGLVYYGNSEGGIMGGAFTALSTDVRRAVLGVPGMDYDLLLFRSADFTPFLGALAHAYPSQAVQQVGFDIAQMLWDRAEADGYAEQITGGLPGTPRHEVLLEEAFGDHQVANIATETEARTIGASLAEPALGPGRSLEAQPFFDLPRLRPGSHGPALYVWDSGVPPAPLAEEPPAAGPDPHDTTPRADPQFWSQMAAFFSTGVAPSSCLVGDTHRAGPCRAPYPGGSS